MNKKEDKNSDIEDRISKIELWFKKAELEIEGVIKAINLRLDIFESNQEMKTVRQDFSFKTLELKVEKIQEQRNRKLLDSFSDTLETAKSEPDILEPDPRENNGKESINQSKKLKDLSEITSTNIHGFCPLIKNEINCEHCKWYVCYPRPGKQSTYNCAIWILGMRMEEGYVKNIIKD